MILWLALVTILAASASHKLKILSGGDNMTVNNIEKAVDRLYQECFGKHCEQASVRFRGVNGVSKHFSYSTSMDAGNVASVPLSGWDKPMWRAFLERAEAYYEKNSMFKIDRIDAVILTPAKGPEITYVV